MITVLDYQRINDLIVKTSKKGSLHELEDKLSSSTIIDSYKTPPDLVTMNSEIMVRDLTNNEVLTLKLVYQFSPLNKNQASILSPLGTALIGNRLNETFEYTGRDLTKRKVEILRLLFQPESSGRFDL